MCDKTGRIRAARKKSSLSAMFGDLTADEQADGSTFDNGQDF